MASRGVHISGSNAGYTVFRGSVKSAGYPLHSPVSPSLPLPCVTMCHHISSGPYRVPQKRVLGHIQALLACGIQLLAMIKPISLYVLAVLTGVDHSVICLVLNIAGYARTNLIGSRISFVVAYIEMCEFRGKPLQAHSLQQSYHPAQQFKQKKYSVDKKPTRCYFLYSLFLF